MGWDGNGYVGREWMGWDGTGKGQDEGWDRDRERMGLLLYLAGFWFRLAWLGSGSGSGWLRLAASVMGAFRVRT